ncbi:DUF4222 domain-containing protein [Citrobacter braakii]|uniref:DUF4222 domain-containing protein n=1 Tax=Citrobacter braakii TaxID=57706 RepID=UPI0032C07E87
MCCVIFQEWRRRLIRVVSLRTMFAPSATTTGRLKVITPEISDRWSEKNGEMITVRDIAFNRVTFVRDGYEYPCIFTLERFVKEFSFVSRGQGYEKRA